MPQKSNAPDTDAQRSGSLPQDQDDELEMADDEEDFDDEDFVDVSDPECRPSGAHRHLRLAHVGLRGRREAAESATAHAASGFDRGYADLLGEATVRSRLHGSRGGPIE